MKILNISLILFFLMGAPSLGLGYTIEQNNNEKFEGEKISFNFQDIEIRAALQIIADFAGFNLIVNDSVKGNVTLCLQDIPWDEALDIILKNKNLGKQQFGKVMLIGPLAEMLDREKQELENVKNRQNLEALSFETIQIHYARAEELAMILKEKGNALLSARGNISVDKRTNILLIQETAQKLTEIKKLIQTLDVQLKQVEIATQIISADNTLEDILGIRFCQNSTPSSGKENLFNDLPFSGTENPTRSKTLGKSTFTLARLPAGTLLELELQALEFESKVRTLSRPKIITTDKTKACVEQGFDIPFQEATQSGGTSTNFKKAVLKLEVTPQITPNNKVILDLSINNDTLDNVELVTQSGLPSSTIKTSHLSTQVLVDNEETIILGGVVNVSDAKAQSKIPFLGDIPLLGNLFKTRRCNVTRKEILIFITPRIVNPK